jgi:hypothetical protein
MGTARVQVTRAFLLNGKRQETGSEIEVADRMAVELIHTNKARRVTAAPPAQVMTTESAADLIIESKGKSNARK